MNAYQLYAIERRGMVYPNAFDSYGPTMSAGLVESDQASDLQRAPRTPKRVSGVLTHAQLPLPSTPPSEAMDEAILRTSYFSINKS